MRIAILSVLFCLAITGLTAQNISTLKRDTLLRSVVINGDTMAHIELREVPILPIKTFKNRSMERQYWRLVYNIKKVLPYSKIIASTVTQVDFQMNALTTEKLKRKFVKSVEDSLWKKYEADMREMTITQGKLLFKLVDRQTSNSSYFWIESFRGSFSAFFWQGVARLFGTSLKSKYDPKGEDALIEQIVTYIERGYI